jgi:hypothetical protein
MKIVIMLVLVLTATVASANPIKNKAKKEARKELRHTQKKFDNRSRDQKFKDLKILSAIALLGFVVFQEMDNSR